MCLHCEQQDGTKGMSNAPSLIKTVGLFHSLLEPSKWHASYKLLPVLTRDFLPFACQFANICHDFFTSFCQFARSSHDDDVFVRGRQKAARKTSGEPRLF